MCVIQAKLKALFAAMKPAIARNSDDDSYTPNKDKLLSLASP